MIVLCPERFEAIREFAKSINDTTFEACLKDYKAGRKALRKQSVQQPYTLGRILHLILYLSRYVMRMEE